MSTKSFTLLPAAACLLFSAAAIQTNNPPDQTGLAESAGANIRPSEQRPPASSNGRTTNESQPVVVTAAVSPPVIKRGGTATLTVRCQIASGYHIAAIEEEGGGPFAPTQFELELPAEFLAPDPWVAPDPVRSFGANNGMRQYEGTVEFSRTIASRPEMRPGEHVVKCRMFFQACNERQCLRPATVELDARIWTSR